MPGIQNYAPDYRIIVGGKSLQEGQTLDVLAVSVTDVNDRADSFSFTVQERRPEPGRLFAGGERLQWMDGDAFREGNEVEIHMGYVNALQLMLRGRIKGASFSFSDSGEPTLQVEGYSLYHDLQSRRRREPFAMITDSGIAEEVAKMMGFVPQVDRTNIKRPLVSPNGQTLAEILQSRAEPIDYEVVVKDKTLYFRMPRYKKSLSPAVAFEWGKDLMSFNVRMTTHGMVSQVSGRASQTTLGGAKSAIVGKATAGQERGKMGKESASQVAGRIYGSYQQTEDSQLLLDLHNIENQQEANELTRAALERRSLDFIQGQASVIGDPRVRAGLVVQLSGLGKRYSGPYYITSATHTLDESGYRTSFEIKRNAL
jgi:uncharacterized protein